MTGQQQFSAPVAQAIQAGSVSQTHHHHSNGRPLTMQERNTLNNMVKRLATEFGEPGWKTWKFLHKTIGVESVEGMCLGHRDQVEAILQLLLDNAALRAANPVKPDCSCRDQVDQLNRIKDFQLKQISDQAKTLEEVQAKKRDLEKRLGRKSDELQSAELSLSRAQQTLAVLSADHAAVTKTASNTRKKLLFTLMLALLATIGAAYFSTQSDKNADMAKLAEANLRRCVFAGKVYPIGSIVEQSDGDDMRCAMQDKLMMAGWDEVKRDKPKRIVPAKRKPKAKPQPQQVEPAPEIKPPTTDDLVF